MSKVEIAFAVIVGALVVFAVPVLAMAYRRNRECRYFAIANIFLFLGIVLYVWLPLMNLPGAGATAIHILSLCSIAAYVAMSLWLFMRSHRIYKRTGKWPDIWAAGDSRE